MTAPSSPTTLNAEQGVQAACFLFEINTKREDVLEIAQRAGIPAATEAEQAVLLREWYGFVHAGVVYGLMAQAPNIVMAEYLRSTRTLLGELAGYDETAIEAFIDTTFAEYMRLMAQHQQKQCPLRLYERVLGITDVTTLPAERVAFLSGMMAITLCSILDKLQACVFEDA